MRLPLLLLSLLAAPLLAQTPSPAPAATEPAGAAQAAPSRAVVAGLWLATNGDRWEFTAGGAFTLTPAPAPGAEGKIQRGTYLLSEDRKLKLLSAGREPQVFEYSKDRGCLILQSPDGNWKLMDTRNLGTMAVLALEDLRMLDAATDQWAIEKNKQAGEPVTFAEIQQYLKPGTRLHAALGDPTGPKDVLGHPIAPCLVDQLPKLHPKTQKAFAKDIPREFWKPFLD